MCINLLVILVYLLGLINIHISVLKISPTYISQFWFWTWTKSEMKIFYLSYFFGYIITFIKSAVSQLRSCWKVFNIASVRAIKNSKLTETIRGYPMNFSGPRTPHLVKLSVNIPIPRLYNLGGNFPPATTHAGSCSRPRPSNFRNFSGRLTPFSGTRAFRFRGTSGAAGDLSPGVGKLTVRFRALLIAPELNKLSLSFTWRHF